MELKVIDKEFSVCNVSDFSLIGILSKISTCLAENGIGIFAISTFNTDYVLTKENDFSKAIEVLELLREGGVGEDIKELLIPVMNTLCLICTRAKPPIRRNRTLLRIL